MSLMWDDPEVIDFEEVEREEASILALSEEDWGESDFDAALRQRPHGLGEWDADPEDDF